MKPRLTKHGDYERRTGFTVFGYAVFVVFTTDMTKSITARYDKMIVEGTFQAMHCREKGHPYSHLFFKVGDCTPGTVAHECWHVVRFLFDDWAHCAIDNETVAYHLGFLVDEVSDFKNDLIDAGIGVKFGVKSRTQEVSSDINSQGTTTGMPRVQSRVQTEGPGEEVLSSETHRGSNSGRCCS